MKCFLEFFDRDVNSNVQKGTNKNNTSGKKIKRAPALENTKNGKQNLRIQKKKKETKRKKNENIARIQRKFLFLHVP